MEVSGEDDGLRGDAADFDVNQDAGIHESEHAVRGNRALGGGSGGFGVEAPAAGIERGSEEAAIRAGGQGEGGAGVGGLEAEGGVGDDGTVGINGNPGESALGGGLGKRDRG